MAGEHENRTHLTVLTHGDNGFEGQPHRDGFDHLFNNIKNIGKKTSQQESVSVGGFSLPRVQMRLQVRMWKGEPYGTPGSNTRQNF